MSYKVFYKEIYEEFQGQRDVFPAIKVVDWLGLANKEDCAIDDPAEELSLRCRLFEGAKRAVEEDVPKEQAALFREMADRPGSEVSFEDPYVLHNAEVVEDSDEFGVAESYTFIFPAVVSRKDSESSVVTGMFIAKVVP